MKSSLSHIHPGAKIAENVTIDPFVHIHEDVEIGEGSHIHSGAVIMDGARIGKNVTIFPGAVIAAIPQDLKYAGEKTTVEIGDNTTIRECATINKGTTSKNKTVVGKDCLLMAYSHVAHDCILGDHIIIANAVQLAGEVEIDDFAILGGGSLVHQFTRIGKHVMIQGGIRVTKDVPPYVIAGREPVSFAGINSIGLNRRGFKTEKIDLIKEVYRLLYQSERNNKDALIKIEKEISSSEIKTEIVDFIQNSQRGIIPGYRRNGKK